LPAGLLDKILPPADGQRKFGGGLWGRKRLFAQKNHRDNLEVAKESIYSMFAGGTI